MTGAVVGADVPIVRTMGLVRRFGTTVALDGVTLDIRSGVTGLLGPNGAGKTTLISLVLGLDRPDAGDLTILGRTPAEAGADLRTLLGYAPEYEGLPEDVRAQDLVRHIAELHGLDTRTAIERSTETLILLGLGEERLREIGTMSTGQRQRVKIAQAVVHDPALVLLDEPTNGLDPLQRDEMLALIRTLSTDLGLDVVVSSHLLQELEQICDAVAVLDAGRLVATHQLGDLTGDGSLIVDTVADAAPAAARLVALGVPTTVVARDRLRVGRVDDDALDHVRDVVADLDLGLRRLQPARLGLQDLWLERVGGDR